MKRTKLMPHAASPTTLFQILNALEACRSKSFDVRSEFLEKIPREASQREYASEGGATIPQVTSNGGFMG